MPLRPYLRRVEDDWQMDYAFRDLPEYRRKTSRAGQLYYSFLLRMRSVQAIALAHGVFSKRLRLKGLDRTWIWEPDIDARVYAPPQQAVHWSARVVEVADVRGIFIAFPANEGCGRR